VEPLDAVAFYDLGLVTELTVSPSGDRIAFVLDEGEPSDAA